MKRHSFAGKHPKELGYSCTTCKKQIKGNSLPRDTLHGMGPAFYYKNKVTQEFCECPMRLEGMQKQIPPREKTEEVTALEPALGTKSQANSGQVIEIPEFVNGFNNTIFDDDESSSSSSSD
jgi:hypothetical protein